MKRGRTPADREGIASEIASWIACQPLRRWATLAGIWVGLGVTNVALHLLAERWGVDLKTSRYLGFSVFSPEPHMIAVFLAPLLVGIAVAAVRLAPRTLGSAVAVGTILILTGNAMQGATAFIRPIVNDKQYAAAAPAPHEATTWLRTFNDAQPALALHARTHPPFATLVHTWSGGLAVPWRVAFVLALAGLMVVPLTFALARSAGAGPPAAWSLAVLAAVVPAVNAYAVVSLDGLVSAVALVALIGLAQARRGRPVLGAALFAAGTLGANLLTFSATLLLALCGFVAAWDARARRFGATAALGVGLAVSGIALGALWAAFGYDHLAALRTAAALENQGGFYGFADPLNYVATRVEGVVEFTLWLGVVAAWLTQRAVKWTAEAAFALVVVALMLLTGAYKTAETARLLLFVAPLLLLPLRNLDERAIAGAILLCALQSAAFQGLGDPFW
jgi:hypothetical protein